MKVGSKEEYDRLTASKKVAGMIEEMQVEEKP